LTEKLLSFFLFAVIWINTSVIPAGAQESLESEKIEFNSQNIHTIPVVNNFLYRIQKYSGFNFLIDFLTEATIKSIVKLKTKTSDVNVDLKLFSGIDLFRKKAKSFTLNAKHLFVSNVPVEVFKLETKGPIYFKKNKKKKYQAALPLTILSDAEIDISDVSRILNTLPKWQKIFSELNLPVPPFGTTKVAINDLSLNIDSKGFVEFSGIVKSLENPESEPIKMLFSGNLIIKEKKLVIDDLQTEIEDIFTKDAEMSKSFSKFFEDLINPVFDFHKYEKGGLTIDFVNLSFDKNKLLLDIGIKLLPEEINDNTQ